MDENPYRAPESLDNRDSDGAGFERLVNCCAIVVAGPIAVVFIGFLILACGFLVFDWLASAG